MNIRTLFSKLTVQAVLAITVIAVSSALALAGALEAPVYFGLAIAVTGFYFKSTSK